MKIRRRIHEKDYNNALLKLSQAIGDRMYFHSMVIDYDPFGISARTTAWLSTNNLSAAQVCRSAPNDNQFTRVTGALFPCFTYGQKYWIAEILLVLLLSSLETSSEEWQSWLIAPVLKTGVGENLPGVRIPPPPQSNCRCQYFNWQLFFCLKGAAWW